MKLVLATLWLLIGSAIVGGLYWGFLIAPVSTVLALTATALLAIAALAVTALVVNGAIEILARGFSIVGVRRAAGSVGSVIPAALILLLLWWVTSRAEAFVSNNSGQINAWFIARFGWDNVAWLFTTVRYAAMWLRWVIGGLLALSLMAAVLAASWSALARPAWIARALRPRALLVATLALLVLIALPWEYLVPWRPSNLPATSIEMTFIVTKLSIAAILAALGIAVTAREVSGAANPRSPFPGDALAQSPGNALGQPPGGAVAHPRDAS